MKLFQKSKSAGPLPFNKNSDKLSQKRPISVTLSAAIWRRFLSNYLVMAGVLLAIEGLGQASNPYHLNLNTTHKAYKNQVAKRDSMQMIDLEKWMPGLRTDIWYATTQNFTGQQLYHHPRLFLRRPAATKLKSVQDSLAKLNLALVVYDAYRPYAVTLKMWEIVPDDRYAANPANGSGHNRGIAVDLGLVEKESGRLVPMPTGFDNFTDTAHHDFKNLPNDILANRQMLRNIMEYFGFVALETEWWHYYLPNPKEYPLMDVSFKKLRRWTKKQ